MIAGRFTFTGLSDYLTWQKIKKVEYSFPEGFDEQAMDLVQKLIVRHFFHSSPHIIGVTESFAIGARSFGTAGGRGAWHRAQYAGITIPPLLLNGGLEVAVD